MYGKFLLWQVQGRVNDVNVQMQNYFQAIEVTLAKKDSFESKKWNKSQGFYLVYLRSNM
jgi:hypothetical protein